MLYLSIYRDLSKWRFKSGMMMPCKQCITAIFNLYSIFSMHRIIILYYSIILVVVFAEALSIRRLHCSQQVAQSVSDVTKN